MDDWEAAWDWARKIWGDNTDYSFEDFFRQVTSEIARRKGWEEVGSSDVWHASFGAVKYIKAMGNHIKNRNELREAVLSYHGICF